MLKKTDIKNIKRDTRKNKKTELGLKGFLRWLIQSKQMPLKEQVAWLKKECQTKLEPEADDLTLMILSG